MSHKLCVIGGDGIGPEVTAAAVTVLQALTDEVEIVAAEAGWQTFCQRGTSVPEQTLQMIRDCGAALFGAVSSPTQKIDGYRSAILTIRQALQLNANLRPVKSAWCPAHRVRNIDLIIVRENSEGLYVGRETSDGHRAVAEKVVTSLASQRIGSWAARIAADRSRNVLIVHKANVLPVTQGLFRDSVGESIASFARDDGPIDVSERLVDVVAHDLVALPESFDVLVTTNMFGDILSDLAAHWCGGMGRAPSLNIGDDWAVAEPVHGSAPDIAGRGIADPTATILSLSLLARYSWEDSELATRIEQVVTSTINQLPAPTSVSTDHYVQLACKAARELKLPN